MKAPIPVLRIFDEEKARGFYKEFLGFTIDWEHRFAEEMPVYMQVSRAECVLHLSGHYGDCTPGGRVRIETPDLDDYLDGLRAQNNHHCKPGEAVVQPWGTRELDLTDPFGNRLTFYCD